MPFTSSFLKYTLLALGILGLFFVASVAAPKAYAADCTVLSAEFSPSNDDAGFSTASFFTLGQKPAVDFIIKTKDCDGKDISVTLLEHGSANEKLRPFIDKKFTIDSNENIVIHALAGEESCTAGTTGNDCLLVLRVTSEAGLYKSDGKPRGDLRYECSGVQCGGSLYWEFKGAESSTSLDCKIKSASFSPSGTRGPSFYDEDTRPSTTVTILSENCTETDEFTVTLFEADELSSDDRTPPLDALRLRPDASGKLVVTMKVGEDNCERASDPDCSYFLSLTANAGGYTTRDTVGAGILKFDCDGIACDDDWQLLAVSPNQSNNPVTPDATKGLDPDSPCTETNTDGEVVWIDGCNELLAPLPGIPVWYDNTTLGEYVNIMVKLIIGLITLLAVIMIIVGGVQYMTTDAIAGKSEAKSTIGRALGGLLIAVSSFIILYTINPNLTIVEPYIPIASVGIDPGGGLGVPLPPGIQPKFSSSPDDDERNLDPKWAKNNVPPLEFTQGGSTVTVRACDTSQMTTVTLFDQKISVRKELASTIEKINKKWVDGGKTYPIPSTADTDAGLPGVGGYNCRLISTAGDKISTHSYGITVDINAEANPMGNSLVTDMPATFVKFFTDEGFGWGGDWTSVKDAMHFSKAGLEGGDDKF